MFGLVTPRLGLTGIAIALLLVGLAVQTVRLEGFKVWPLSIEGARPKAERLEDEIAAIIRGQEEAAKAQRAVNEARERTYEDIAERIDDAVEGELAGELDAASRFIAANRVRCPAVGSPPRRADPAAEGNSARSGQEAGPAPLVDDRIAVAASDVMICTANTVQAEAARAWALELEATD